jgi:sugar-specific transcriptional regulator TrmB
MAKVRLLDEFLCPICMDYFTQAKRLSCQHHFCEACIATYASRHLSNDRQGGASNVTLPCPVCGTTFHWPEGGAQALQADLFLNRMMEVLKVGQRDVTQYDDVLLQAEDNVDKHDEVIRDGSATDDVTRCDHHLDDKAIALCLDCPQAMCARCVKRALEDPAHPCSVHVHQCVSMEESDTEVTARYTKVKVEVVEIKQQLQELFDTIASAITDVKREKHKVKAEATARHGKAVVMLDECLSSVDEQVTAATGAILQRLHALKDDAHCTVSRLKDEYMRAASLLSDKVKVKGTVQKLLTLQQLRKSLIDIRYSLATISEAVDGQEGKSAAAVLSVDLTRPDVAQAAKNLCMTLVGVVQHHQSTVSWKTGALSEDIEQSPCCADDVSLTDIFGRYTDTADTVSQCHAGRTFLYEMGCLSAKVDGTLRLSAIRSKLAALTLGPEGEFLMIDKQHDLVVVLDPLAKVRRTFVANQPIGVCWWKDDTILISHGEAAHCVSIYRLSGQCVCAIILAVAIATY